MRSYIGKCTQAPLKQPGASQRRSQIVSTCMRVHLRTPKNANVHWGDIVPQWIHNPHTDMDYIHICIFINIFCVNLYIYIYIYQFEIATVTLQKRTYLSDIPWKMEVTKEDPSLFHSSVSLPEGKNSSLSLVNLKAFLWQPRWAHSSRLVLRHNGIGQDGPLEFAIWWRRIFGSSPCSPRFTFFGFLYTFRSSNTM